MKRLILRNNECYEVDLDCLKKKEKGQNCTQQEERSELKKRRIKKAP